jgi:hypothetical protein
LQPRPYHDEGILTAKVMYSPPKRSYVSHLFPSSFSWEWKKKSALGYFIHSWRRQGREPTQRSSLIDDMEFQSGCYIQQNFWMIRRKRPEGSWMILGSMRSPVSRIPPLHLIPSNTSVSADIRDNHVYKVRRRRPNSLEGTPWHNISVLITIAVRARTSP